MAWTRREFLAWMAASTAAARAFGAPTPSGFSILQGMTDETSAQFSLVVPLDPPLEISVEALGLAPVPRWAWTEVRHPGSLRRVIELQVDNLTVGGTYLLRVLDQQGVVLDEREFAALDLAPRKVRLAFISCALDHLHRKDIWRQLERQKPELVFFLGDNAYCDRPSVGQLVAPHPDLIWERYVATREKVMFYRQRRLTPVLAIWDDHDFGGNNVNGEFQFKRETTEIFSTFFAQQPRPALEAGPGIARRFRAFGADFFLLDGRTFRGARKSHQPLLGAEQESWLCGQLGRRPTWLLNGSVFFGAYGDFESFEGDHSEEFAALLRRLKASEALVAFVSGDVHYSELMDIEAGILGYPSVELVSSSIHSFTFPSHHERFHNPRRRLAESSHNFVLLEAEFGAAEVNGHVTCWGPQYDLFDSNIRISRT